MCLLLLLACLLSSSLNLTLTPLFILLSTFYFISPLFPFSSSRFLYCSFLYCCVVASFFYIHSRRINKMDVASFILHPLTHKYSNTHSDFYWLHFPTSSSPPQRMKIKKILPKTLNFLQQQHNCPKFQDIAKILNAFHFGFWRQNGGCFHFYPHSLSLPYLFASTWTFNLSSGIIIIK